MDALDKALRASVPKLLELPNVVGVGKGYKQVGGKTTEKPAVTVLVKKKLPKSELQSSHVVPATIASCHTDVIEVGEIVALARTDRERPARPGVSIGHYKVTAGTFGAVVYDMKTGEPLILSNNHVLANSTNSRDGRAKVGDPILQPGRYDGGSEDDVIGHLYRFVPIFPESSPSQCKIAAAVESVLNKVVRKFRKDYVVRLFRVSNAPNLVDAAVAKPLSPDLIKPDILDLGVPRGIAPVEVGMRVYKSGRTSGTNSGQVKVVEATIRISMGEVGEAVFADQVVTTKMAEPGDSGSLVVNEKRMACGLLSAGSDTVSIFAPIKNVCEALSVRL